MIKFHKKFQFANLNENKLSTFNAMLGQYVVHFLPKTLKNKFFNGNYELNISSYLDYNDNSFYSTITILNNRNDKLIYHKKIFCDNISLCSIRNIVVHHLSYLKRQFNFKNRISIDYFDKKKVFFKDIENVNVIENDIENDILVYEN